MTDELRERYAALLVTGEDCIHCGSCTRRCPFGIDASENMRRAQGILDVEAAKSCIYMTEDNG